MATLRAVGPIAFLALFGALEVERAEAAPATYTVSKTADTDDGTCDADCSLREAIGAANGNVGETDTIDFDGTAFSPGTITLDKINLGDLPAISEPVEIDGLDGVGDCSAGGNPQVNIDGSAASFGPTLNGGADGTTICGVATHSFPGNGITIGAGADDVTLTEVNSGTDVTGSATGLGNGGSGVAIGGDGATIEDGVFLDNGTQGLHVFAGDAATIQGNLIGIAADGTAQGNVFGINIGGGVSGGQIGGTAAGEENVISSNSQKGILSGGDGATIEGNLIGTDAAGTVAKPNARGGINLSGADNTVGGTAAGAGNVISGNHALGAGEAGVSLSEAGATGNAIEGNLIGTDVTGTVAIDNQRAGVEIRNGATDNTVGGTAAGAGNLISGNGTGVARGVLISDATTTDNTVAGNLIGTDVTGTIAVGNGVGVDVDGAASNTIGGVVSAARNVISGGGTGVRISGDSNAVQRNYIGLDVTGVADVGNSNQGVLVDGGSENQIGTAGNGNVISGSNNAVEGIGVKITGAGASGNQVRDNLIGTGASGLGAVANAGGGVLVDGGADSNTVGGPLASEGNLIAGNSKVGVRIAGAGTADNAVAGNRIGLASDGSDLGNGAAGVRVEAAPGTKVGGADTSADATTAGARNVISGNAAGVEVAAAAAGRELKGNFIGTSPDGSDGGVGNDGDGVLLENSGSDPDGVEIGGSLAGEGNRIVGNGADGVAITAGVHNTVSRNEIDSNGSANGDLGIDLGDDGVSENDPGDSDGSPNHLQNFPDLAKAETNPVESRIEGSLDSEPNRTYTIELFSSTACDTSINGEGASFLASFQVTTDGGGQASFSRGAPVAAQGDWLTATATDPEGDTSEFSDCRQVAADTTPPETTITSGPAQGSSGNDPTPTFGLSSNEAGVTFECSLDGGGFASCSTPWTTSQLGEGNHTVAVRATDSAANTDPSPAQRGFTVDTTPPETTIDSGPADGATINDPTPSFSFSADEAGAGFACRLGPGAFGGCPGGGPGQITLGPLADGGYSFAVRATDPAGNTDASPAQRDFTVDTRVRGAKLKGRGRQRQRGRRIRIGVKLKARKEALTARVGGRVKIGGRGGGSAARAVRLKGAKRSLEAGERKKVRLRVAGQKRKRKRLERRIVRSLKRGRRVRAKLRASFRDGAGNADREKLKVRLRR